MLPGFFDQFFELCLPFVSIFLIIAVFCKLSSSSIPRYANLYHRCAVFLVSSFTFSPALLRFPESFVFLIIPFPKTDAIPLATPHTEFAALRSFSFLVQKLSLYLLLSAVATLGSFLSARALQSLFYLPLKCP